jgi:hypothetical protein
VGMEGTGNRDGAAYSGRPTERGERRAEAAAVAAYLTRTRRASHPSPPSAGSTRWRKHRSLPTRCGRRGDPRRSAVYVVPQGAFEVPSEDRRYSPRVPRHRTPGWRPLPMRGDIKAPGRGLIDERLRQQHHSAPGDPTPTCPGRRRGSNAGRAVTIPLDPTFYVGSGPGGRTVCGPDWGHRRDAYPQQPRW